MPKVLVILLWPAGLAVIIGIGALLASRATRPPPARAPRRRQRHRPAWRPAQGRRPPLAGAKRAHQVLCDPARGHRRGVPVPASCIGLIAVHAGPSIDKPIWHWTVSHQVHGWVSVMKKATQTAATFTVLGAAVTAAVCLVFVWRRDRWLPPVALATLIVVDHYLTMALTDTFNRVPPPHSGGTFPSGASDRAVAYYGLIAFLLWRAVSGRRQGGDLGWDHRRGARLHRGVQPWLSRAALVHRHRQRAGVRDAAADRVHPRRQAAAASGAPGTRPGAARAVRGSGAAAGAARHAAGSRAAGSHARGQPLRTGTARRNARAAAGTVGVSRLGESSPATPGAGRDTARGGAAAPGRQQRVKGLHDDQRAQAPRGHRGGGHRRSRGGRGTQPPPCTPSRTRSAAASSRWHATAM